MTPRTLRRISRALDAVASRLGRLAALLDVYAEAFAGFDAVEPEAPRVANACQFCGAPPGRAMCHGCPGIERGLA